MLGPAQRAEGFECFSGRPPLHSCPIELPSVMGFAEHHARPGRLERCTDGGPCGDGRSTPIDRLPEVATDQRRPGGRQRSACTKGTARVRVRDRLQRVRRPSSGVDITRSGGDLGLGIEQRGQTQVAERGPFLRGNVERMRNRVGDERRCRVDVTLLQSQQGQPRKGRPGVLVSGDVRFFGPGQIAPA